MQFKLHTSVLLAVLLFFGSISVTSWSYNTEPETGSLLLTTADFQNAVNENSYLLVNFHALWCKYSKKLKPEWQKLSDSLRNENSKVKLAKVEAYDEKDLAERYGIEGYPTIKLFINGDVHPYSGENLQPYILEFVHRKLKEPLTVASDLQCVQDGLKQYEWVGILIGEDASQEDVVKNVAFNVEDVLFLQTNADDVKKNYGNLEDGQFVLVNNVAQSFEVFSGDFTQEGLSKFIDESKFPTVAKFSKGTAERVFLSDEPSMILLRKKGDNDDKAETAFQEAAKTIGNNIFMTVASFEDELGKKLAENIGVEESELPTVRIIKAEDERIKKYYLDGDITADSVTGFYNDYQNKKAKRFYLSEPVPKENNDLVKKVVTKSFQDMVLNPNDDVLLLIWTPWCGHCRAMLPVYDNVARKTREVPNFVVAKIDASENDLEIFGLDVTEYPAILLYTRKDKANPVEFKGDRTEYVFNDFIRAHATVDLARMKGPNPFDKNEL